MALWLIGIALLILGFIFKFFLKLIIKFIIIFFSSKKVVHFIKENESEIKKIPIVSNITFLLKDQVSVAIIISIIIQLFWNLIFCNKLALLVK